MTAVFLSFLCATGEKQHVVCMNLRSNKILKKVCFLFLCFSSVTHLALFVVVWHFSLMRNDEKFFKVRLKFFACTSTVWWQELSLVKTLCNDLCYVLKIIFMRENANKICEEKKAQTQIFETISQKTSLKSRFSYFFFYFKIANLLLSPSYNFFTVSKKLFFFYFFI